MNQNNNSKNLLKQQKEFFEKQQYLETLKKENKWALYLLNFFEENTKYEKMIQKNKTDSKSKIVSINEPSMVYDYVKTKKVDYKTGRKNIIYEKRHLSHLEVFLEKYNRPVEIIFNKYTMLLPRFIHLKNKIKL